MRKARRRVGDGIRRRSFKRLGNRFGAAEARDHVGGKTGEDRRRERAPDARW